MTAASEVRAGQIWKEDDKRFDRYILVTDALPPQITFITCDADGNPKRGARYSCGSIKRFGKSRGYKLVKDCP